MAHWCFSQCAPFNPFSLFAILVNIRYTAKLQKTPTPQGHKTDEPKQLTGFAAIMAKQEAKKAEPKTNEIRNAPPPTRDKPQKKDTHEL